MNRKLKTRLSNVTFQNDDFLLFEKAIALAQKKFGRKFSNREFVEMATIKYCDILISLEKK